MARRTVVLLCTAAAACWQVANVCRGATVGFAEYYILPDEADLIEAYKAIPNSMVPGTATAFNVNSRLSIVASSAGTHVYVDEWEDGYDFDPDDPYNTADAKWDTATGGPGEQGDALDRGEVLVLTETNTYVSGSEGIDGGDRIFISGAPVFVVRVVWPDDPGSYIAGAWALYPVSRWQDAYEVPVGEDLTYTNSSYPFEYSFLFIQVASNNTRVVVTDPALGVILDTNLSRGANIYLTDVNAGTHIAASDANSGVARPVQAVLMSSVNEWVDTRFYTLTPQALLGTSYIIPAPSQTFIPGEFNGTSTNAAYIYAFEDNTTVEIETYTNTFEITLTNRGDVYRYELPLQPLNQTSGFYAAHISSTNSSKKIWVLVAADDDDDVLDWGYQVLDEQQLAMEYYCAYAPANPIYVAPVSDDAAIWVDFDNDGTNDRTLVLDRLEMAQIYDPDTDATGVRVYGNQPFALVWGQDNTQHSPGEPLPDYDYGYTILPLYWRNPVLSLEKTASPETLPSTGGVVTFTLVVTSYEFAVYNVDIYDVLPEGWEYISNSTVITFSDGSPSLTNDPVITGGRTLAWELDYDLGSNQSLTVQFQAETVTASYQYGYNRNDAWAYGTDRADETNNNAYVFQPFDTALVYIEPPYVLSIEKFSDATNAVNPGDVLTYTIVVTNSSSVTHTGVRIRDYVPTGATYVAGSTYIVYPEYFSSNTVRDEFNARAYTNNDGTVDWSSDWVESEGNGPTAGDLQVRADGSNYRLRYRDDNLYIYRSADLSGATAAVLSLYYRRYSLDNINEWVRLRISDDGGSTWTVLDQYTGPATDPSYIFTNYDITAYISSNTVIQFWNDNRGMGNVDLVWFDDIEIAFLGPGSVVTNAGDPPPILADEYTLAPGQWMVVQFQVTVDNPCAVTQLVNTAYVRSDQMLGSLAASVTDTVVLASVGDWVWLDANTNGIQDASETTGVAEVTVRLYDAGTNLVDTTQTDSSGYYSFSGLGAGNYFLEFVAPSNYYLSPQDQGADDTVDSDPDPTNGRTAVFYLSRGTNETMWDAGLYLPPGAIGDYVWFDANTNGIQDAGEGPMTNVTVWLYDGASNLVDTAQSDAAGYYLFTNVVPGSYFLEFEQPADYTFTLQDQGSDDTADSDVSKLTHRTDMFYVPPYGYETNWDAGYILPQPGLAVSKSSNATNCLSPGDTLTYTIEVQNTGTVVHSIVQVYDPVPEGATYVSNSTRVIGYGVASNTVRDEFNAVSYTNNDGTVDWLGPWVENDPDGNPGPVGDYVGVTNGRLRIHYAYVGVERAERSADLGGYTSAVLSFDWETVGLDGGETISVLISTDGVNYTELDAFGGTASGWTNYDISAYISPSTTVRFANESLDWELGEMVFFDNVEISMVSAPGIVTNAGYPPPVLWTNQTLATGETLTITFRVTVDSPGTVSELINTASVVSATQPTISDVITDCVLYAELALRKEVSETSPAEGESIQYVLTLTNEGPDEATGVEVTDVMPEGVTYHSHSNGVYNAVSGVWQAGNLAAGASTSLYIMVGVDAGTAGQQITNTASISAKTRYDPIETNNHATAVITPVPTLVLLSDFSATPGDDGVQVAWETASEVGTLGFNLYRAGQKGTVRVNEALLPAQMSPQGAVYRLVDPEGRPGDVYRLVEVDVHGRERTVGLARVPETASGRTVRALSGKKTGPRAAVDFQSRARSVRRMRGQEARHKGPGSGLTQRKRIRPTPQTGNMLKLMIYSNGIYYLSATQIASSLELPEWYVQGLLRYRYLRLENMGDPVPYLVPDDYSGLYFYGQGPQTIFADYNVYWLGWGRNPEIESIDGGRPPLDPGQRFFGSVRFEEDRVPAVSLFDDPEADFWLWDVVIAGNPAQQTRSFDFSIDDAAAGSGTDRLSVELKGASDTRHHALLRLNGVPVAECVWSGRNAVAVSGQFAHSLLLATNTVEVTGILDHGVPYSVFGIDSFEVNYWKASRAVDGRAEGTADGRWVVTVDGFSGGQVVVLDIDDPGNPRAVENVSYSGSSVCFWPWSDNARYAAAEAGSALVPQVVAVRTSQYLTADYQIDYLVIASDDLADAAKSLAAFHQVRGLRAMTVPLSTVYDVFNYGVPDPWAIRRFLDYAYTYWTEPPVYVVLVGKGSYDYRDYLGYGENYVPARLVRTPDGLFASDVWYADVVGEDGVPEFHIGRIPAISAAEVQQYIGKLHNYEAVAGDWTNRVLFVADNADEGGEFAADSDVIARWVGPPYELIRVYLDDYDPVTARGLILSNINQGVRVISYLGHAGLDRLAHEGLLLSSDAALLNNGGRLPVLVAITCVAGRFEIPGNDCIGEALLLDPDGGVVAVLAPSGLSLHQSARLLDDEFMRALFGDGVTDLGAAVGAAREGMASRSRMTYLLYIYNLLGDPALPIR